MLAPLFSLSLGYERAQNYKHNIHYGDEMQALEFTFIGEDNRLKFCERELKKYLVFAEEGIRQALIYAPNKTLSPEEALNIEVGSMVFAGRASNETIKALKSSMFVPFLSDFEFVEANAKLTAEGALALIIEKSGFSLFKQKILIIGYGRIGKALTKLLWDTGAKFAVASRDTSKVQNGVPSVTTGAWELDKFDTIVNTAPALVLDERELNEMKEDAVYFELASPPYGIDLAAAEKLNRTVHIEPAIPARFMYKEAGRLMIETFKHYFTFVKL